MRSSKRVVKEDWVIMKHSPNLREKINFLEMHLDVHVLFRFYRRP